MTHTVSKMSTKHSSLVFIPAADDQPRSRPAKVRRGISLSPEYELSRLVENVTNHHPTWGVDTPAFSWKGVHCDENGTVVTITWPQMHLLGSPGTLRGTLEWSFIPATVHTLNVAKNNLEGGVQLEALPQRLETLQVHTNRFSGSLNLCALPVVMTAFHAQVNYFSGPIDLTRLPDELRTVYLFQNELEGEICLSALPAKLNALRLSKNRFSGEIDIRSLTSSLRSLSLSGNQFTKVVGLEGLKSGTMTDLDLRDNKLTDIYSGDLPRFVHIH